MNNDIAIRVDKLSKVYKLYDKSVDRLKESLHPFKKKYHKDFYALKDISFKVTKGETIGIIGKNGSGKSTLLKIITGVLSSTSGNIVVNGKISALLELGAGFNPEYTGIENIYLQGAIMGYTETQMEQKLQEILDFADIGNFVYQPVKTYSSGMFVRLAFAVAISVEPEILIVDEALAVGDIFFQNKCYKKFQDLQSKNITILFVSHDIGSVKQYCNQVIWLEDGKIKEFGKTKEICNAYINYQISERNELTNRKVLAEELEVGKYQKEVQKSNYEKIKKYPKLNIDSGNIGGTKEARILSFFILDENNNHTSVIEVEKEYTFVLVADFFKTIKNALFGFTIENIKGVLLYATNNYMNDKVLPVAEQGNIYEVTFKVKLPKFQKGTYLISPAIATGTQDEHKIIAWYHHINQVEIINTGYNQALIEIDNEVRIEQLNKEKLEFY